LKWNWNYKCQQCQRDHRYKLQESTVPLWPSTAIADSAMVAIGTIRTMSSKRTVPQWPSAIATDSVMVTIGTNHNYLLAFLQCGSRRQQQQPTGIPGVGANPCKPTPTPRGLCTQFIWLAGVGSFISTRQAID
jgi:hypothetical protein